MSTTNTPNLGIAIPVPGSAEPFLVTAYNSAITTLDGGVGFTVCTSSTRPAAPYTGQSIFETDTLVPYIWDGAAWQIAGGGTSNEASDCIQPNFNTISEDYTFTANYNGVSAGPITIASGFTVTVGATSAWSIV